jgi:hypothetical protein
VRRLLAALALAGALAAAAAAAAASPTVGLPDCLGKLQVRPASVVLTCADANFAVRKLRWTGWGSAFAAGIGTAVVNDCTPTCVAGKFHNYRIVLIASGSQSCPTGRAYAQVTYAFIGRPPFSSTAADSVYPRRCRYVISIQAVAGAALARPSASTAQTETQ